MEHEAHRALKKPPPVFGGLLIYNRNREEKFTSFLTKAALFYPPQGPKKYIEAEVDSDTELFEVAEME